MRMLDQLKLKVARSAWLAVALLVMLSLPAAAQTASVLKDPAGPNVDALPFLNEVFGLYAHATSYHLESIEETALNGEFSRRWNKSVTTAIVGPSNQFRFESQGEQGRALQISDGETEWVYDLSFQQYIQHPTPSTGPSDIRAPGLSSLTAAHNMLHSLSSLQRLVRTAVYTPDETIQANGKTILCKVIKADGELPVAWAHITTGFVFWIDKQTNVILKMTEHREGPLRPTEPDMNYVMERHVLFIVADLALESSPDQNFKLVPPMTASLVRGFEGNDRLTAGVRQFVGKQAPDVSLKAADGKDVSQKSFQGKPVLLDFWATWCPGCVYSLPMVEKLYHETAKHGLVLLSIDEDENPKKGDEFWSKHTEPWPNYHASADVLGHFPDHGIPYFVLIDASGQVVFSAAGLDETALRAALSKLGPAFAALSKTPAP